MEVGWRDCEPQNVRELAVRLSPRNVSSDTHKVPPASPPKHEQTTTVDTPRWMGKKPQGLSPTQKTIDNQGMLRVGETVFPEGRANNWLSKTKWSAPKHAYKSNTTQTN